MPTTIPTGSPSALPVSSATGAVRIYPTGTTLEFQSGSTLTLESGSKLTKAQRTIGLTDSTAVLAAESGTTFLVTSPDLVMSLPATAAGLHYTFLVAAAALSSGTGLSLSPVAADKIMANGITSADNKDLINSGATDAEGDMVSIWGDGADGWYVTSLRGTWAREA